MIAADSSTVIAFFQGEDGHDVELLDRAMESAELVLPPVVLTEVLSDPGLSPRFHRSRPGDPRARDSIRFLGACRCDEGANSLHAPAGEAG